MIDLWTVLVAETRRQMALLRAYPAGNLAWLAMTGLLFLAMVAVLEGANGGAYGQENHLLVLVGWLAFQVAGGYVDHAPRAVADEAETGTLEQLCLGQVSLAAILIARSLVYLGVAAVRALLAALLLACVLSSLRVPVPGVDLLVLFVLGLPGACGLGLLMAGLALIFKRVRALTGLVFGLMVFLTGAFVGLEKFVWTFAVTRLLVPLTWTISLMRRTLVGAGDLPALWRSGELAGLALHSSVYLIVGLAGFALAYREARRRGTLAHY